AVVCGVHDARAIRRPDRVDLRSRIESEPTQYAAPEIEQPYIPVSADRPIERDATAIGRQRGIEGGGRVGNWGDAERLPGPIEPYELSLAVGRADPVDDRAL